MAQHVRRCALMLLLGMAAWLVVTAKAVTATQKHEHAVVDVKNAGKHADAKVDVKASDTTTKPFDTDCVVPVPANDRSPAFIRIVENFDVNDPKHIIADKFVCTDSIVQLPAYATKMLAVS